MKVIFLLMLCCFCIVAKAKPVEEWRCKDVYGKWDTILVTTTVEEGRQAGTVSVAGVTHNAQFEVAGFDRRWDFGLLLDGTYKYAFIIRPNGDATYYDFDIEKKSKPSNFMKCRQAQYRSALRCMYFTLLCS